MRTSGVLHGQAVPASLCSQHLLPSLCFCLNNALSIVGFTASWVYSLLHSWAFLVLNNVLSYVKKRKPSEAWQKPSSSPRLGSGLCGAESGLKQTLRAFPELFDQPQEDYPEINCDAGFMVTL